jgi:alpha-1,6-mannosyltransferase
MGSCALTVGSLGVGAVPARLAGSWLHDERAGRGLSYGLVLIGVLGLLFAWWQLRGAATRDVLVGAAVWSVPLLVSAPLFSRDVFAYAGQAHLVDVGLDPYTHGPADAPGPLSAEVDDVWARARSPYGPVFLRVASWLTPGQHVVAAVLLQRALVVLGFALLAWALLRMSDQPSRTTWLAVANPLVLLHGVSGAHNDLLMAGLLVAGVAVAGRPGRRLLVSVAIGAALVTVAALVKAPAAAGLVFVPFVVPAAARLRAAAVVAVTAVVVAVGLTTATGLGWGWLHTLGAGNPRRSLLSISTGAGVLVSDVAGDGAVHVAQVAVAGVAALIALWLLVRLAPDHPRRAIGLTLLLAAALGPVVQPWYLLWGLPFLAVVAGTRLTAALAAASAVTCLLILPSGRHVIRPPLYGVPALLVIAVGYAAARRPALWESPQRGRIGP